MDNNTNNTGGPSLEKPGSKKSLRSSYKYKKEMDA